MKICIAVSEFNPFHNGHTEFLRQCRALTGADAVVCAMGGNFTQRGEIAIMEKRARARVALTQGADAVIELPTPIAVGNAERFAQGAIALFQGMKAELVLCCGSEIADSELLLSAARFFSREPKAYQAEIQSLLKQGEGLPKAREKALFAVNKSEFAPLLGSPNATLAVEYAKACLKKNIAFFTYQRTGSYHAETLPQKSAEISGSAIRKAVSEGKKHALAPYLPTETLNALLDTLPCVDQGLFCSLLAKSKRDLRALPDCTEGLENRIFTTLRESENFTDFLEKIKTKRYVLSRLKRISACALLGVETHVGTACQKRAPYLRVLGVKKGKEGILSALATAKAPLLTKRKDAEKLKGYAKKSFMADERAEAIFRQFDGENYPFFVKI
ncbi:MAG: nucleotidyltransferase family protein [Clostridiales bacterium]|nr:nucleotidyltransferase family protein [Clostridiales bacterium]